MEKRVCNKCNQERESNDFFFRNKKKNIKHKICRFCQREGKKKYARKNSERIIRNSKRRVLENKMKVFELLKQSKCSDCGNDDPRVLDFDHKSQEDKFMSVSEMILNKYSWKKISLEIKKCDIRCANCHRIKTSIDFSYYKNVFIETKINV